MTVVMARGYNANTTCLARKTVISVTVGYVASFRLDGCAGYVCDNLKEGSFLKGGSLN